MLILGAEPGKTSSGSAFQVSRAFAHLMSPGRIGRMALRNRIFLTPMGSNLADPDGYVGQRLIDYYTARAKGGAALVTMGSVSVGYPDGSSNWRQEAISDDRYLPGLQALADSVHAQGAKLCAQLHHAGLYAMNDMLAGRPVWTPSLPGEHKAGDMMDGFLPDELEIFNRPYTKMGPVQLQPMGVQDIERLVQMFAAGAERAKRAGLDAVEIHAGHGYILSSFLSPNSNRRTDEYGGSVENRSRLLVDIVKAIRSAVGPDFPVWARLDSQEFLVEEGIALEDAKVTAKLAQEAGLDALNVTAYSDMANGIGHSVAHATHIPGKFVPNAMAIRAVLDIPVITAGRIELDVADRLIGEGKLDFVGMGRKLLADPELPNKLAAGRAADVRPCIYCYTCISQIYFQRSVRCAVNPDTGAERDLALMRAPQPKHITVVGGGPAGMESARRLSLQGHRVILLEASDRLGGTARFASIAYAPNQGVVDWLIRQVGQSAVEVRLNARADLATVRALDPDFVVVATGAIRAMPPIPGADRANVFDGDEMRRLVLGQDLGTLKKKVGAGTRALLKAGALSRVSRNPGLVRQASRAWMPLGRRIVIIGAELVGMELAEFLALRGRRVTLVDPAPKPGTGLQVVRRWRLLQELRELGVAIQSSAADIAIGERAVSYRNEQGQIRSVGADHVIVAQGARGDLALADALRGAGFIVHTAGDCEGVGYIDGAMAAAARVAKEIGKG